MPRLAASLFLVVGAAPAWANGAVTGTVRVDRALPPLPSLPILKDASVCGRQAPNDALVVGRDGALTKSVEIEVVSGRTTTADATLAIDTHKG